MKAVLLTLLILAGDPLAAGLRAFRAGDARAALAAFDQALARDGETASAALHYDRALAALHCSEWDAAEASAQSALDRGGIAFAARVAFLRGCMAAQRAEAAAVLAAQAGAIPADWDLALARGRSSLDAFALALDQRENDWPEARRNAARVMLRLEVWQQARTAAEPPRDEATPKPQPARVEELLQRLEGMERPLDSRTAPDAPTVERDW
ncbi:MAG: hypothetical protein O3A20_06370 [Planctomycetota bacterium]|nr:hypothetical protein [Planctomycetota bacterium]